MASAAGAWFSPHTRAQLANAKLKSAPNTPKHAKTHQNQVVFIESICNDEVLVQRNIVAIHQSSPEFEEKTEGEVGRDVRSRIKLYQRIYQVLCVYECVLCVLLMVLESLAGYDDMW